MFKKWIKKSTKAITEVIEKEYGICEKCGGVF